MKILYLTIDAFQGYGGIAQYNKNALHALAESDLVSEIIAVPRYAPLPPEPRPSKIKYVVPRSNRKADYIATVLRETWNHKFDLVICAHLNLLPLAVPMMWFNRSELITFMYGIEAWTRPPAKAVSFLTRFVKHVVTFRKYTFERFQVWTKSKGATCDVLSNCVDDQLYCPGTVNEDLVQKYELQGKEVIMTMGRLDPTEAERNKGFDEIIELLPDIKKEHPNVKVLIVGEGEDRARLEAKAKAYEAANLIVFTGHVDEAEKIDLCRLSAVLFMAGRNPLFDRAPMRLVLLEAVACGTPFVASLPDHDNEVDAYEGMEAAIFVDPNDAGAVVSAVSKAINLSKPIDITPLKRHYYPAFKNQLISIVQRYAR